VGFMSKSVGLYRKVWVSIEKCGFGGKSVGLKGKVWVYIEKCGFL
jgi:hypothetical protein